jgi:uncharacterized RDD family membrane protein YckC
MSEYNIGGTAAAGGASGPRAGIGNRFVAALIDGLLVGVVQFVLSLIIGRSLSQLLGLVLAVAYFAYFEGQPAGQTLGKRVMGIRTIDFNTGGSIDTSRAAIRGVVRVVSGLACGLGFIWALFNKEKQTWHDMAAQTVVVPVSAYPVP